MPDETAYCASISTAASTKTLANTQDSVNKLSMIGPQLIHAPSPKICIFCGGESRSKLSKEHIWPKWASDHLPKNDGHGILAGKVDVKEGTSTVHQQYRRQGPVSNFTIRNVCQSCNNGWMGDYEERFRDFAHSMINGNPITLDEAQCRILIEYICYKILIIDVGFKDRFIPDHVAREFYEHRKIPDDIEIYILNCPVGNWRLGIRCVGGFFAEEVPDPKAPPNVKSYAFGFGNMFVYAIYKLGGIFPARFSPGKSISLFPPMRSLLRWPPILSITDGEAESIAMAVVNAVGHTVTIDYGKV